MTMEYQLLCGDCLEILPTLEAGSIHAVVCDPPYGLSFMGKNWDHGVPGVHFWEAALRVAKPGAMLLAFGGTRTFHRLTVAIEDAGWEIRDCLMWLYGSGFPKSMDISKAIDKAAGAEREVVGRRTDRAATPKQDIRGGRLIGGTNSTYDGSAITAPATDAARQWAGWGTALKPAWEPIIMAMKPFDGTFANNALVHGVGGINVDGCRIPGNIDAGWCKTKGTGPKFTGNAYNGGEQYPEAKERFDASPQGRWPANLLLDEEAATLLDGQSGDVGGAAPPSMTGSKSTNGTYGQYLQRSPVFHGDSGGASRFFYVAKASRSDRNEGLEGMPERESHKMSGGAVVADGRTAAKGKAVMQNHHPTVKPTQLMRYLCRLVTPPNGTVLDPFMGSGSTGKAAMMEGFGFVGIEKEAEYVAIAQRRLEQAAAQPSLFAAG